MGVMVFECDDLLLVLWVVVVYFGLVVDGDWLVYMIDVFYVVVIDVWVCCFGLCVG